MLPAARDPNFQTEEISIFRQFVVLNYVKMSVILWLYHDEAHRFSDEIQIILKKFC